MRPLIFTQVDFAALKFCSTEPNVFRNNLWSPEVLKTRTLKQNLCRYLVWRTVHPAVFLEVLLEDCFDLLIRFRVAQPLPLHQALEERLQNPKNVLMV